MKKKLKISELRVKSFVTHPDTSRVMGGSDINCGVSNPSCDQDYPSCNPICHVNSFNQPCLTDLITP